MTTIFLALAYVALGGGFAAEITSDNPRSSQWTKLKRDSVTAIIWLTWPIWFVFMVGAKVAEKLQ